MRRTTEQRAKDHADFYAWQAKQAQLDVLKFVCVVIASILITLIIWGI